MVSRASLVVLAVMLGACTTARTEIILVTDTDLSTPDELDEMSVEVTSPGGTVQTSVARFGAGELPPPRVVGLVNDDGRLGPYAVRVRGLRAGAVVVERRAEVDFQPQRTLVLRIELSRACIGVTCGASETCVANTCRSIEVDPDELEEWQGQIPIPMNDASVEPPQDGGRVDGGRVDGGRVDGGRVDGGCVAEVCNGADDDCDGSVDEDFDLDTDPSHCGACGNTCTVTNGTAGCAAGSCTVEACDAGWDDCDSAAANGCEANLTRPDTCGSCTNTCRPPDRDCCDGTCC